MSKHEGPDFGHIGEDQAPEAIAEQVEAADPTYYAGSEHDRDDLPWPLPADEWFWQSGDRWVAVYAAWHEDWWEGCDPADIAARPNPWRYPIDEVPTTGTLHWLDGAGRECSQCPAAARDAVEADRLLAEHLRTQSVMHGFAAVRAGDQDWGANDRHTSAVDTIANVLHWLIDSEPDTDAQDVLDSALGHYKAERT